MKIYTLTGKKNKYSKQTKWTNNSKTWSNRSLRSKIIVTYIYVIQANYYVCNFT